MDPAPAFVAIDLGAESGRVVVGRLERGVVRLEEAGRFANRPVELPDGLHWNTLQLFRQSLKWVGVAGRSRPIRGIAVDAWGVDYGLLDEDHRLLGLPFHYRDRRTEGQMERAADLMPAREAYAITGIRPMPINTSCQLLAEEGSPALSAAHRIALIPDLIAYWLCGVPANERTAASTTGLLDARTGEWAHDVVDRLGLPGRLFSDTVEPGTVLGPLLETHAETLGLPEGIPVVATAAHDTAAAFAGVPSSGPGAAVLSSGTWSLLGLQMDGPVLSEAARAAGLSNERGVFGTTRLLRNVMGLWLVQQCRAAWSTGNPATGYDELVRLAAAANGPTALFDPDDPSLGYPGDMPTRIETLIRKTGQPVPQDRGAMIRSIFFSLACAYRSVLEELERLTTRTIGSVQVVGGGSRNELLCQLTADITRREIIAGPAEASALGNILMQAAALGYISGEKEMREVARASVSVRRYLPRTGTGEADEMYQRFLGVAPTARTAAAERSWRHK
ncbi:MAG: rhamnulokinase [Thermoleophilia bacterium]|nr:rhamnulokinase [Thermoleophilia bacterium]